jgi:hypothetical protein
MDNALQRHAAACMRSSHHLINVIHQTQDAPEATPAARSEADGEVMVFSRSLGDRDWPAVPDCWSLALCPEPLTSLVRLFDPFEVRSLIFFSCLQQFAAAID